MQQAFAISGFINFVVFLFISVFVFSKRRGFSNIMFSVLTLSTAVWSFGYWQWLLQYQNGDTALFWLKFLTVGSIWIPILFMHWISSLFKKLIIEKINNIILFIAYFFGLIFTWLNIFTPLMVENVREKLYFKFWPDAGDFYIFYILLYLILTIYTGILLVKYYGKASGYLKNQIKYVTIACLIALLGGFFNFFLWYDINIPPYGNFIIPIYPVLIAYTIVKYRLMDIRFVISRSILYFILIISVTLAFTFITFLTGLFFQGRGEIWTTLAVSLIIVIGLDPLKKSLARWTDKFFFKGKIDYQDVLRQVSEVLARELDLNGLVKSLAENLENALKLKRVELLGIKKDQPGNYINLTDQNTIHLKPDDVIISSLNHFKTILITEELARRQSEIKNKEQKQQLEDLEKRLDELNVAMLVPIFSEDQMMGIFFVGHKLSGSPFTQEDLNLFEVLAPQVATSLEKSRLFEEVQAAKANLEVLVDKRTRDLKERNQYLTALQTLINVITRSLDFKKVMQTIADGITKELGFIGGILSFVDFQKKSISIGAISQTSKIQKVLSMVPQDPSKYAVSLDNLENMSVRAINERRIITSDKFHDSVVPAIPKALSTSVQKLMGIKSVMSVPVYSEEKVIGVIDFILKKPAEEITEVEKEMMKSLSDQVGIVYRNLTLYNRIQKANDELKVANARLTKLDEAKSEFLSIASHQLRTPLTGIKGYLSMILEGDFGEVSPDIGKVLRDVFENTDRLTRLVNIFLNVSRIESGRFEIVKKDASIVELIEEVIKELILGAEKKGLKLTFHKPAKVLPLVKIDKDKIKDVTVNLVDNSIKYTPKGQVEVFVEQIGQAVKVTVKDTGIGIEKGKDRELFKKFVRGEGIAQINTGGSGLGLYIAKRIIEGHGGKIWAESEGKDMGSSFIFTLPLE